MPSPGPSDLSREIARILRLRIKTFEPEPTQASLATAIGASQPFMSGALNGNAVFDIEQLDILCRSLGLEIKKVILTAETAVHERHAAPDFTVSGVVKTANLATSKSKKKADQLPAE